MSTISLPKSLFAVLHRHPAPITVSPLLLELANSSAEAAYAKLGSTPTGLTAAQASRRLAQRRYGGRYR